jgi:hypothetical protein
MKRAMKTAINPAYLRIALRYGAGMLAAKALLPQDIANMIASDPELVGALAALIAVAVEGYYAIAKRFGWRV